jgi:pimeloyl-ACP methyl ester carboxylesterase
LWVVVGFALGVPGAVAIFLAALWFYLVRRFQDNLVRIFKEKPLFIIPRGQPVPDAEDVHLTTDDGLTLRGCYLHTTAPRRRGVILFGLEFGSNRWSCVPYCEALRRDGFDIFAFEFRGQGESDRQEGYEPLQWVTDHELRDMRAALTYLKTRPDADPRGVGFFGISKGGTAGLFAGAADPYVRCFVTDGIFATYTTMVPYMRKWIAIYGTQPWLQRLIPSWYYGLYATTSLKRVALETNCVFPHLEPLMRRLAPRPLLMIHGGADTYIKPEMAQALFRRARQPKEIWLVEGAKHNQALHVAGDDYRRRVCGFFRQHLADRDGDQETAEGEADEQEVKPRASCSAT